MLQLFVLQYVRIQKYSFVLLFKSLDNSRNTSWFRLCKPLGESHQCDRSENKVFSLEEKLREASTNTHTIRDKKTPETQSV